LGKNLDSEHTRVHRTQPAPSYASPGLMPDFERPQKLREGD
jgi:hypothetical protein